MAIKAIWQFWCYDAPPPPLINRNSSLYHDSICLRPYTALVVMVIMTVSKSEDEFELELCRNRGADWRHNQHNYIFSGFLKKVGCK